MHTKEVVEEEKRETSDGIQWRTSPLSLEWTFEASCVFGNLALKSRHLFNILNDFELLFISALECSTLAGASRTPGSGAHAASSIWFLGITWNCNGIVLPSPKWTSNAAKWCFILEDFYNQRLCTALTLHHCLLLLAPLLSHCRRYHWETLSDASGSFPLCYHYLMKLLQNGCDAAKDVTMWTAAGAETAEDGTL